MPFLAYVAVILVSLGGILFEVNWLTSPKLETKPAVQASKSITPPKIAVATTAPHVEETPAPNNEVAAGPRNVAPNVTMVPGGAVAPKTTEEKTVQEQTNEASAPAITPAPAGLASSSTTAAVLSPTETTGVGSTDFKREFSTDAKADGATSSATFTPVTPAAATPVTPEAAALPVAASSNNKCDIAACSAAYQSFRTSDCTYQPMDGNARKVCDRTQGSAQQVAAPLRERKIEASIRKPNKDAELRSFEREVRRITDREMATVPGIERGMGRSEVIVYERPGRDW
jgi:hypothetical protein